MFSSEEETGFELRTPSTVAVVGDSFFIRPLVSTLEARRLSYLTIEGEGLFEITSGGYFTALEPGTVVIAAKTLTETSNEVRIEIVEESANPYRGVDVDDFYRDYVPASSSSDAYFRSLEGLMSGDIEIPGKKPEKDPNSPKEGDTYVKNGTLLYEDDGSTYCLLDYEGNLVSYIYRSGAYVTLEEVAAYIYAFQDIPPNYDSDKEASPLSSMWGEYLRVNHSYFSGDTSRYPYEPELPHIEGCPGGYLTYYELDIGTTGSGYSGLYNDGYDIDRGAARIVYARYDEDDSLVDGGEDHHLFYTYNHYNDKNYYVKSALTTQGVGIMYRKEFNKWSEWFSWLRRRKNNTEKKTP